MTRYEQVTKWPRKSGKTDYLRFLNGEKLTRAQVLRAKCYECVTGEDTKPCIVGHCPISDYCQWGKA